ncbi:nitrous oxide reductase family maturation protein NosD [Pseudonocardia sp. MH-G8]|uniref:right-handed parallel beta-helix repeat-containing protein n=1 Tax=Pseudonocardia sp. MH-G8 TaxID=1854588 RepID=UPI00117AF96A|nr:right-handed parallel beta-helix repeat-containing protein [Pseudonocardia sp. MH-G8]
MSLPPARRTVRATTLGVLVATAALLAGACSAPTPDPIARQEAAPNETIDPAQPCVREPASTGGAEQPASGDVSASFVAATNTIELRSGTGVSLPALADAVGNDNALRQVGEGEWELRADISVINGASLHVAAPEVRWLKLVSEEGKIASLKPLGQGSGLQIDGSCITSWDIATSTADTNQDDGRGYILARDGAVMNIDNAEIRYLGNGDVESYGLSWRTEGTTGSITNSVSSHNYFGLYSYEVGGLVVADNEFHDNSLYGVDPHTGSHDMTIERNVVHDNGKHGIILAEDCVDSVIRDNIVYRNNHHGIVLYLNSDRNTIEGNDTFANVAQGININESNDNIIRGNRVYDNKESGIGITQTSKNNLVEDNQARGNAQDGVRVVSEAAQTTLRANTLGENGRYGVYVDIDGDVDIAGNTIFANRSGIMLKGSAIVPDGDNSIFNNAEDAIVND